MTGQAELSIVMSGLWGLVAEVRTLGFLGRGPVDTPLVEHRGALAGDWGAGVGCPWAVVGMSHVGDITPAGICLSFDALPQRCEVCMPFARAKG